MNITKFYDFKEELNENGILYSYSGSFSQGLIEEIGLILKTKMNASDIMPNIIQKIFSVFIEQVQNIMKYSIEIIKNGTDIILKEGTVAIGESKDKKLYVISGNKISKEQKKYLEIMLNNINNMNEKELKTYFKEKLKENSNIEKGSAGLGLVDMARKSEKPIEYLFKELDDEEFYFIIKVNF